MLEEVDLQPIDTAIDGLSDRIADVEERVSALEDRVTLLIGVLESIVRIITEGSDNAHSHKE